MNLISRGFRALPPDRAVLSSTSGKLFFEDSQREREVMIESEFKQLLEKAIARTITEAQQNIAETLPQQKCFYVENDTSRNTYYLIDGIMQYLYKDGSFPRLVDIAVRGVNSEGYIIVWLRISGHNFVRDIADTWNTPIGSGPFKSIGLMLPHSIWIRPRPLFLHDLKEAGQQY